MQLLANQKPRMPKKEQKSFVTSFDFASVFSSSNRRKSLVLYHVMLWKRGHLVQPPRIQKPFYRNKGNTRLTTTSFRRSSEIFGTLYMKNMQWNISWLSIISWIGRRRESSEIFVSTGESFYIFENPLCNFASEEPNLTKYLFYDIYDCQSIFISRRAYGSLNVRSLLDVREQYLNEFSFPDPYAEVSYDVYNPFQSVSTSVIHTPCLPSWICFHCAFLFSRTVIKFLTRLVCVKSNCPKVFKKYHVMQWKARERNAPIKSYSVWFWFGFRFCFWFERLTCYLIGYKIMHAFPPFLASAYFPAFFTLRWSKRKTRLRFFCCPKDSKN